MFIHFNDRTPFIQIASHFHRVYIHPHLSTINSRCQRRNPKNHNDHFNAPRGLHDGCTYRGRACHRASSIIPSKVCFPSPRRFVSGIWQCSKHQQKYNKCCLFSATPRENTVSIAIPPALLCNQSRRAQIRGAAAVSSALSVKWKSRAVIV